MKNIDPIVEFILQVENENKKPLTETEIRQVLHILVEKIQKTKKGYFATSKGGRKLSKKPKSKKEAAKQLAAVEISKQRRSK
jgi:hypothetical protein